MLNGKVTFGHNPIPNRPGTCFHNTHSQQKSVLGGFWYSVSKDAVSIRHLSWSPSIAEGLPLFQDMQQGKNLLRKQPSDRGQEEDL